MQNGDQSKVFSKIPGLSRTCWYDQSSTFFKSQLKIDATFDQNDEIRSLQLRFWSKIFLVETFDRDWFDENQEKKSIDKIHSKNQTKPTISNLSWGPSCSMYIEFRGYFLHFKYDEYLQLNFQQ